MPTWLSAVALSLWSVGAGPAFASEGTISVLHSFSGHDGATAKGSLTLVDGLLFGRTSAGGASNKGVVFSFDPDSMVFRSLHSFTAGPSNGTGNRPHHDSMTVLGSALFGTALYGGNTNHGDKKGNGVVFSVSIPGGVYSTVYAFEGGASDSSESHSCFLVSGSILYGMSAKGGLHGEGTIYSIDATTGAYTLLYSFRATRKHKGTQPHGRLIFASDGTTILGMTRKGGKHGYGVVFSFAPGTRAYTVLHDFKGAPSDGATTDHGYLVLVGTTVYGMTTRGGAADEGVIFRMSETGAADGYELVHSFGAPPADGGPPDGSEPFGSLALSGDYLYGLTRSGGAHGDGTIFRVSTDGTTYAQLASFETSTTGGDPIDNVTFSADGLTLYGLTQSGGLYDPDGSLGYGTIFSMDVPADGAEAGLTPSGDRVPRGEDHGADAPPPGVRVGLGRSPHADDPPRVPARPPSLDLAGSSAMGLGRCTVGLGQDRGALALSRTRVHLTCGQRRRR